MSRELVWLENPSFAAWGCSACDWIVPNNISRAREPEPSTEVREAFRKHECAKFPHRSTTEKRPPRSSRL